MRTFTCCIVVALLMGFAPKVWGQFNLDSLRRAVAAAPDWRAKMEVQYQLATSLHSISSDSLRQYAVLIEAESERRQYSLGKGMACELYALYHVSTKEYEKCFDYYRKSIAHYEAAGEQRRTAKASENMAFMLSYLRHYGEACDRLYRALDIETEFRDSALIASTCLTIGMTLSNQQLFGEAEAFFRRAIGVNLRAGLTSYPTYSGFASMFSKAGKMDSSLYYHQIALQTAQKEGNERAVAQEKQAFAALYAQIGDYERAEPIYRELEGYVEKSGDKLMLPNLYLGLAAVENHRGNFSGALTWSQKALNLTKERKNNTVLAEAYALQLKSYEGLGNYPKALEAAKAWKAASDSTMAKANAAQVADISYRYRNREQQATIAEQALQLEREANRRRLLIFSGLLLLAAAVGFFLYLRSRERLKKHQTELALQLEQAESDKLRELDRLKSDFFANVSHELRTPLTLIQGPVDSVLKSEPLSSRAAGLLRLAQQNAGLLLRRIGEILDLTKLESGKMTLEEEAVALYPWLNRSAAQFDSQAERVGVRLVFQYQAPPNLQVLLDRKKMATVFNNLLSNALKYTPAGGSVIVRLEDRAENLLLSVEDTGRGIPPEDLDRVFDRFYRVVASPQPSRNEAGRESARSEIPSASGEEVWGDVGGTGIGLAICREYAALLGGRVWAESPAAGSEARDVALPGSVFCFEFPKKEVFGKTGSATQPPEAQAAEAAPETAAAPLAPSSPAAATILLVEDNEGLQQYLKAVFSPNFQVVPAFNGTEALRLLHHETQPLRPDLIVSDIMMPVMDGLQLLDKLKSDERLAQIPVIMLTARADMHDKLRALRVGVDDYLLKPFVEEELLARAQNLLHNHRARVMSDELGVMGDTNLGAERITHHSNLITPLTPWLSDLEQVVAAKLADFNLTAETLADGLAMSRAQFFRQVKKHTGLTPAEYLDEARFRQARQLLETRQARSVKSAAYSVGFRDEKHFAKEFRRRYGKYPSEYLD